MDETKNDIGKNKITRRAGTAKVTSTTSKFRQLASETEDFKRDTERQAEIRSDRAASNGFLKCKFLPKLEEAVIFKDCNKIANTEREFYKSLSKLSKQYLLQPMQTKDYGFPYNLALAMWDVEIKMTRVNQDWNSFKLIRDNKKIHFAKEERFDMGTTLYFIPILPLFQMLHNKSLKKNAQLLLSVFSYLYQITDVPYYRRQESYLYWIYEMHEEWMEQDDVMEEDLQEYEREFKISKNIGGKMQRKIFNSKNLEFFERRLNDFRIQNEFDMDCQKIASDALTLYKDYPKTTIFRNKPSSMEDLDDDDYSNRSIEMEKYISFVADTKGSLYRTIEESLNAEFNEYGSMEEPTIYSPIDKREVSKADFDFENRFFALIENLNILLTN